MICWFGYVHDAARQVNLNLLVLIPGPSTTTSSSDIVRLPVAVGSIELLYCVRALTYLVFDLS